MLALGRYALARGLDLRINRLGRLALVPVMASLFFAVAGAGGLAEVLLYIGLAIALAASGLYIAEGVENLRAP